MGAKIITGQGGLLDPARLVCHCLLIEGSEGLVLVDTGFGIADLEDPERRLSGLVRQISRMDRNVDQCAYHQVEDLGFHPEDVRDIVVTHLDVDHAGGISDFPWANVHVLDLEVAAATHPQSLLEKTRYSAAQLEDSERWISLAMPLGERWFGFEKVQPLLATDPDILMIPLHGHTRGHCGVAVKEQNGWLLHCGDAFLHRDELDPVEPTAPLGIKLFEALVSDDRETVQANQTLLRQLYQEHSTEIRFVNSHDPEMFQESIRLGEATMTFAPGLEKEPLL